MKGHSVAQGSSAIKRLVDTIRSMLYRMYVELSKPGSFATVESCLHDLDSPVGQHNLRADAFPDFQPEFYPMFLSDGSSLVDLVDVGGAIGGDGLMVSEKVLGILEHMKLPPYQPYRVDLTHRGRPVADRYFWLQILTLDNYGWIDFGKSQFTLKSHLDPDFDSEGEPVQIGSERELKGIIESKGGDFFIFYRKLTLNSGYARSPFDLFYFDRLGGVRSGYPIVGERLKAAFESAQVAGYALRELQEVVIDERRS